MKAGSIGLLFYGSEFALKNEFVFTTIFYLQLSEQFVVTGFFRSLSPVLAFTFYPEADAALTEFVGGRF